MKKFNIANTLKSLDEDGIAIVENLLSQNECNYFKKKVINILNDRKKNNLYVGNNLYQVIENFFAFDKTLFDLIFFDVVDQVLNNVIDTDYVLISSCARNSFIDKGVTTMSKTSGVGWHTDTRYVNKKKISPSMIYGTILNLEDWTLDGGVTEYIPKSHKKNYKPKRDFHYNNAKKLVIKSGSLVFFDSALWHKAGTATNVSRWAIFSIYGPWFMKPYFQFNKLVKKNEIKDLHPKISQLLHFESTPPTHHNERNLATLKRIRKKLKIDSIENKK